MQPRFSCVCYVELKLDVGIEMGKKQYPLRLDQNLYAALERWAADEFRSVNAHIEFLLRESVRKAGRLNSSANVTPEADIAKEYKD